MSQENGADDGWEDENPNLAQTINDEYETWMENKNQLYGTCVQQELERPHFSFQWLPGSEEVSFNGLVKQRAIMGTYTADDDDDDDDEDEDDNRKKSPTNHVLQVVEVTYENTGHRDEDEEPMAAKMETVKLFNHVGDVNKARYMPQNPSVVATISGTGGVYLFDLEREEAVAQREFKGHQVNGYGLSWHPHVEGYLLTSCEDGKIIHWDIEANTPKAQTWKHKCEVNDVQWHHFDKTRFGAVTEDSFLNIYDHRVSSKPQLFTKPHKEPINSLSFNKFNEYLVLTASHDHTVGLYDMRYLDDRLHTFVGHDKHVDSVEWSPHSDAVFASSARDRRVILWDIRLIGEEQQPDDTEDAAPELAFMHGGHKNFVNDLSWNPDHDWVLGSLDNDCVQIWRPKDLLVGNQNFSQINDGMLEY